MVAEQPLVKFRALGRPQPASFFGDNFAPAIFSPRRLTWLGERAKQICAGSRARPLGAAWPDSARFSPFVRRRARRKLELDRWPASPLGQLSPPRLGGVSSSQSGRPGATTNKSGWPPLAGWLACAYSATLIGRQVQLEPATACAPSTATSGLLLGGALEPSAMIHPPD